MLFPAIRQALKEEFWPAVSDFAEKATGLPIITKIGPWTPLTIGAWLLSPTESIVSPEEEAAMLLGAEIRTPPEVALELSRQLLDLSPDAGIFIRQGR